MVSVSTDGSEQSVTYICRVTTRWPRLGQGLKTKKIPQLTSNRQLGEAGLWRQSRFLPSQTPALPLCLWKLRFVDEDTKHAYVAKTWQTGLCNRKHSNNNKKKNLEAIKSFRARPWQPCQPCAEWTFLEVHTWDPSVPGSPRRRCPGDRVGLFPSLSCTLVYSSDADSANLITSTAG